MTNELNEERDTFVDDQEFYVLISVYKETRNEKLIFSVTVRVTGSCKSLAFGKLVMQIEEIVHFLFHVFPLIIRS